MKKILTIFAAVLLTSTAFSQTKKYHQLFLKPLRANPWTPRLWVATAKSES